MLNANNLIPIIASLGCLYFFIYVLFFIVREPILMALNFFAPDKVFKVRLSMAERGYYKYDGLMNFAKIRGFPVGRVIYPDGKKSVEMALGTAVEYREMFGGTIIKP